MKILVTSASWKAALTVLESLGKQGHTISLIDSDPYSAGFYSKYCYEGLVSPDERDKERYITYILNIIKTNPYNLLIPISDLTTEYFSERREEITKYVKMLLPPKELIDLARNKDKTYRFALDHDIVIPATYFPSSLAEVTNLAQKDIFPCIVKKAKGTANKGNTYIRHKQELIGQYTSLDSNDERPVIQEFVDGDIYGFAAVCQEGEIIDCFMFRANQEYALAGTAPYSHSVWEEKFFEVAKRAVKILNWTGVIDLDYIKDKNGEYRLLEINPRFSGTSYFAYKCGVDLPVRYCELVTNNSRRETFQRTRYRAGLTFRCIFPQEVMFCLKNEMYFFNFFKNFFNFRIIMDLNFTDPQLVFWLIKHTWWYWRDQIRMRIEKDHEYDKQESPSLKLAESVRRSL